MFSERLKSAMKYRNKTITDLSQNCNLSKGLISNYLKGRFEAKQKNVYLIAKYLEINPSYLLGLSDDMIFKNEDYISDNKQNETNKLLLEEINSVCSKMDEEKLRAILIIVKSMKEKPK